MLTAAPAHADPAQTGRWSTLQEYPLVPISAALTTDGKIVAWDQADPGSPHPIARKSGRAIVIDPDQGVIGRSANLAPQSVFCPLILTMPNGKVAMVGGGNDYTNQDTVHVYDPKSRTFGQWSALSVGRWYPGGNVTKDGDIVALGGRGGSGGDVVDVATGTNRRLNIPFGAGWYPVVLRMPDGRFLVEDVADAGTDRQVLDITGSGTLVRASNLTLLQNRARMAATMIGPYRMLANSGYGATRDGYIIDVSTGKPVVTTTGSTTASHTGGYAITLPDGTALTLGGNTSGNWYYGTPSLAVERWAPETGSWTRLADSPRQRQYHSVLALLPDGRVWSAGTSYYGNDEPNGAYFSPPYLFKKDGSGQLAPRPQISSAPPSVRWGQALTVTSPQASSIRKASLVRMAATTHQFDFAGNFVPLDVGVSGDRVTVTVPANGNTVPAGSYMLFLVDSSGVPSTAAIVRVDPSNGAESAPTAMASSQVSANAAYRAFDGAATGPGFVGRAESDPWWQVDLGRVRDVGSITITNSTAAGTTTRLREAWVFASETPLTSTSLAETRAQPGVKATQLPTTVGATVTVPVGTKARYVRVQLPRMDTLNFQELQISEAPVPAPPVPPAAGDIPSPAAGGWKLNGAATIAGADLQLTPATADQKGSAFWPTAIDPTAGMTITFDATVSGGTGADGLALVLADATKGATATSLGGGGSALGFGGIPGAAVGLVSFPSSFVGISDGAASGWQTLNWPAKTPLATPLQGTTRSVKVTLSAGTLTTVVDGITVSRAVSLGNRVLVGFSAATGGLTNRHAIRNLVARVGPAPAPTPTPETKVVPDPAAGGWTANGAASVTGGKLQLTPPTADQKGSAFWPTALDTTKGLTVEFDATIADGTGADGLAMILADPTRGATAASLGGGGGALGFGGIPGLAVGLSTFPTSAVGISDGVAAGQWQTLNWLSRSLLPTPLQNTTKRVKVTITPTSVTAVLDGGASVTRAVSVPAKALLGFGAGTGGLTNRHAISSVSVTTG